MLPSMLPAVGTTLLVLASSPSEPFPAFRVYVRDAGVYELRHGDLLEAGWSGGRIESDRLSLSVAGRPVPIFVEDGGDGFFDPGDRLEFVGERLAGERSYYHEYGSLNVYRLAATGSATLRMHGPTARAPASAIAGQGRWSASLHLEEDRVLLRLLARPGEEAELWYWLKLTHLDARPRELRFDLPGLAADPDRDTSLHIHFRGWSTAARRAADLLDHRVDISLNGEPLGGAEWDGQDEHLFELDVVPHKALRSEGNTLSLAVPSRLAGDETLIDVVMLNWVELRYPRTGEVMAPQTRLLLEPRDHAAAGSYELRSGAEQDLVIYTDAGMRLDGTDLLVRRLGDGLEHHLVPPDSAASSTTALYVVADGRRLPPVAVELDRPSHLRKSEQQADYLMIVHPRLRSALEPLAALHRRRGLRVEVVEIQDVYDEFNHGVVHPRAIRDFIGYAYHQWQTPHPRFVLLVGDASWDTKNREIDDQNYPDWTYQPGERGRFVKNQSTPYSAAAEVNRRALIPTWSSSTGQGHSASDNWFVAVDGDDFHPDLAIGRLPITEPDELSDIIRKIEGYLVEPEVGPWRRRVLWITNDEERYQRRTREVSDSLHQRGFEALEVFPRPEELDNRHHQDRLRSAFDEGTLLVHFFGHGGRYIWRTGPPDPDKNHDLFTLADLDRLESNRRLPLVLSMTCYSAPFDHPNADSIGEKLLRLPDRGAIAVLAASWRNTPTPAFSRALLHELLQPGTIGEAIVRAKARIRSRILVEQYNLLGDPALPLALPQSELALAVRTTEDGGWRVRGALKFERFRGRVLVEWLDGEGDVVAAEEQDLEAPGFAAALDRETGASAVAVRAYMWDPEAKMDGLGFAELRPEPGIAIGEVDRAR